MLTYKDKFNGGNTWSLVYKNRREIGVIKAMGNGFIFHAHDEEGPQTYTIYPTVEDVKKNLEG